MKFIFPNKIQTTIYVIISLVVLQSCANIIAPSGGPKDESPPVIEKEVPNNYSTNFTAKGITLFFDEFIELKNPNAQILISPPIFEKVNYQAKNKSIRMLFPNSLQPQTTYSINFGESIQDLNEGNTLLNYKYVFSTGSYLDSLNLNGKVIDSRTGKPSENISIYLYNIFSDSVVYKEKPTYIGNTDKNGNFTLTYLKEGKYKLFALNDLNFNYVYDPNNESIAFSDSLIPINLTTVSPILKLFKEHPASLQIIGSKMDMNGKIEIIFNKHLIPNALTHFVEPVLLKQFNKTRDTLLIWPEDLSIDSLQITIEGLEEGFSKTIHLNNKLQLENFNIQSLKLKTVSPNAVTGQEIIYIKSPTPFTGINKELIKIKSDSSLPVSLDSIWIDRKPGFIGMSINWKEPGNYELLIDSNAVKGIYGRHNHSQKLIINVKPPRPSGTLILHVDLKGRTEKYIIEIIDNKGDLVKELFPKENQDNQETILFPPGNYEARIIHDINGNGKWDPGNYLNGIKPEHVKHYPSTIEIRANWENELILQVD